MSGKNNWIEQLEEDDLVFLKRFLLASGSLKELAASYRVSYPTIRLRLDRLIEKVKILDTEKPQSLLEKRLRLLYAEEKIDLDTLRQLEAAYHREKEEDDENTRTDL